MNDTDITPSHCHFGGRSKVSKSHFSMVQRTCWQEISRLRVSIETKSLPSYRHVPPLEMTQGLEALLSEKSHRKKAVKK
ncbi:MAG TPA: hypothetical protein DGT53_06015 [Dialister sp.]|nr:hypothetical protein [Dialister sp.]